MKIKYRLLILFALLCVVVSGAAARQGDRSEDRQQQAFPLASGGQLRVENYKGKIEITATDSNEVRIDVTKYVVGSNETTRRKWLNDVQVRFSNSSNRVEVKVDYPEHHCYFGCDDNDIAESGVILKIQAPRDLALNIEGYKPDMVIQGIHGPLSIHSYKSDIQIDNTQGSVNIESYKNRIALRKVTLDGALRIDSYKGEVEADLNGVGTGATISTYKGSVLLRLPQNTGVDLDYRGGRKGSFESDFPVTATQLHRDSVQGPINGGGPRLTFDSERGTLAIRRGQ